jgi:hypothetical protein
MKGCALRAEGGRERCVVRASRSSGVPPKIAYLYIARLWWGSLGCTKGLLIASLDFSWVTSLFNHYQQSEYTIFSQAVEVSHS